MSVKTSFNPMIYIRPNYFHTAGFKDYSAIYVAVSNFIRVDSIHIIDNCVPFSYVHSPMPPSWPQGRVDASTAYTLYLLYRLHPILSVVSFGTQPSGIQKNRKFSHHTKFHETLITNTEGDTKLMERKKERKREIEKSTKIQNKSET